MTIGNKLVAVHVDGEVGIVEMTRDSRANALGPEMFPAIAQAVTDANGHDAVRALVLCGRGRHFCAGGDLDHPLFSDDDLDARRASIEAAYAVTTALLDSPKPIVAAVQGRTAGAALAMVMSCDISVAASSAKFSLDFVRLGLSPDMGVCWLLAQAVGTTRALDIAMTADVFGAEEAHRWGLVSRVVPDGDERSTAISIARGLAQHPPAGLANTRRLVRAAPFLSRAEGFAAEIETMTELTATPDAARLEAFRQRARQAAR